ncbi:hypothetical protein MTO96_019666 [Rhipicephalus appendiculatus]
MRPPLLHQVSPTGNLSPFSSILLSLKAFQPLVLPQMPPAYYGYGVPDLGYGVGSYEYGRGLIGYGLNYGYGLGTPLEYNALLRKKKCAYERFIFLISDWC